METGSTAGLLGSVRPPHLAPPPPPSNPPPSPRSDLRQRGLGEDEIQQYAEAFSALDRDGDGVLTEEDLHTAVPDANAEEMAWLLKQFFPAGVLTTGSKLRVDLVSFARKCESTKPTEWADAYEVVYQSIVEDLKEQTDRADALVNILLERANVEVTKAEAEAMLEFLESKDAFLEALQVKRSSETKESGEPKEGGELNALSLPKAILGDLNRAQGKSTSTSAFGKIQEHSDLPFFDGTGDPSGLPAAGPSLSESKNPPPTPPPLPTN